MARPPQPAPPAGASSRAPLSPQAECEPGAAAIRMPPFDAPHAPARPARLRGRPQALLKRSAATGQAPRERRSAWPGSFFDDDGQP